MHRLLTLLSGLLLTSSHTFSAQKQRPAINMLNTRKHQDREHALRLMLEDDYACHLEEDDDTKKQFALSQNDAGILLWHLAHGLQGENDYERAIITDFTNRYKGMAIVRPQAPEQKETANALSTRLADQRNAIVDKKRTISWETRLEELKTFEQQLEELAASFTEETLRDVKQHRPQNRDTIAKACIVNKLLKDVKTKHIPEAKRSIGDAQAQKREAARPKTIPGAAPLARKAKTGDRDDSEDDDSVRELRCSIGAEDPRHIEYNKLTLTAQRLKESNLRLDDLTKLKRSDIPDLEKYVGLVEERNALLAVSPEIQNRYIQEHKTMFAIQRRRLENIERGLEIYKTRELDGTITYRNEDLQAARKSITQFAKDLHPDFLHHPKEGAKDILIGIKTIMSNKSDAASPVTVLDREKISRALCFVPDKLPDCALIRNAITLLVMTDNRQNPLTTADVLEVFQIMIYQLFPEEKLQAMKAQFGIQ